MSEPTKAELPDDHRRDLRAMLTQQLGERRRWLWPTHDGIKARARAVVAEMDAETAAAVQPKQHRERAARLNEQLATARTELNRAEAERDQAAGAVRGVMLAGGDVDQAEARRDGLTEQVQRLRTRVADLEGAASDAGEAVTRAEQEALEAPGRDRIADARAEHAAAVEATDAVVEKFFDDLAAALVTETELAHVLSAMTDRARRPYRPNAGPVHVRGPEAAPVG